MLVGTNVYEADATTMRRQRRAIAALRGLPGVEALNVQFQTGPWATLPGIEMTPALVHDSLTTAGPGGRRKPLTRELFDVLAAAALVRGHRFFAYINSDIVILAEALATMERFGKQTYAVCRHDVDAIEDPTGGIVLTAGLDMFVLSVEWWQRHRARFRSYVVGDACWDNVYAAVMMCHSDGMILNRDRLILHQRHHTVWHDVTTTARYNGFVAALDARYFSLWCDYWDRLVRGRAQGASPADEQALRDEVFVWRPSAATAMRQSLRNVRARLRFRQLVRSERRRQMPGRGRVTPS